MSHLIEYIKHVQASVWCVHSGIIFFPVSIVDIILHRYNVTLFRVAAWLSDSTLISINEVTLR